MQRGSDGLGRRLAKALLDEMTRINETEQVGLFAEQIAKSLSGMTKVKGVKIKEALQDINIKSDVFIKRYLQ